MPPVNVEGDSEGEFFEYSEVEDLLCDRVQEYQQCDAVEEIVSVVELFEHAVTAGYSTPVGQRFVMEIAERCLAAQRIVPASEWDAARKRLLLQWHPDKQRGDARKAVAGEVFKIVSAVMDGQAAAPPPPPPPPCSPPPPPVVEEKKWELCMGGCGAWLKAGGWGVCNGCYKRGHAGRAEECEPGFVLCRGCGVHVKASSGACKPCVQKERQASCVGEVPVVSGERRAPTPPSACLESDDDWHSAATPGAASDLQPAAAAVPVPGVKKFGIKVVMPEGADLQPVCGAFLIDSFSYMVDQSKGWREEYYVARVLRCIWDATGKVFMAVCKGGAAFTPERCRVTYAQLLAWVPEGVELIIPVSMGNDIYKEGYDDDVEKSVFDFCAQLRAKAKNSFPVFGGSAATWQYSESKGPVYDAHVRRCQAIFHACGVRSVTGAEELAGLKLVDRIGHVDVQCESIVFAAYRTWVDMALDAAQASAVSTTVRVEEQPGSQTETMENGCVQSTDKPRW